MKTARVVPLTGMAIFLLLAGAWIASCAAPGAPRQTLLIATTTSLYDTGLLDELRTDFEGECNCDVRITAQGTGRALELARRGDVDILLVHDPAREAAFIAEGYGSNRRCFAYNTFLIVGPAGDPAGIRGMDPEAGFRKILVDGRNGTAGVAFVSRGDASGTHAKEQSIWNASGFSYPADVQKSGAWYLESGKGMGETLVMASEKGAYTLTDEGTYLAFRGNLQLEPLIEQGDILLNVYSAMAINPARYPGKNPTLASQFINYLLRDTTQQRIADYGRDRYGNGFFHPLQGSACGRLQCDCTAVATSP